MISRLTLANSIRSRTSSLGKDAKLVNAVVEQGANGKEIVKRPGLNALSLNPVITPGQGQGIYSWGNFLLSVVNNYIYTISGNTVVNTLNTGAQVPGSLLPFSFTSVQNDLKVGFQNGANLFSATSNSASILTLGTVVGGTGYTPASGTQVYSGVSLINGTGVAATGTITVTNGVVVSCGLVNGGIGYTINDSLSALSGTIGGTGSGFTVSVATVSGSGTPSFIGTSGLNGIVSSIQINSGGGYYGYPIACTVTSASPCVITTTTPHGLSVGQGVCFTTVGGTLPSGISAAPVTYQVSSTPLSTTFTINTCFSGSGSGTAINTSTTGSLVYFQASPTVTFTDQPGQTHSTAATGVAVLSNANQVTTYNGVTLTNPGAGYTAPPNITFSAPANGTPYTFAKVSLDTTKPHGDAGDSGWTDPVSGFYTTVNQDDNFYNATGAHATRRIVQGTYNFPIGAVTGYVPGTNVTVTFSGAVTPNGGNNPSPKLDATGTITTANDWNVATTGNIGHTGSVVSVYVPSSGNTYSPEINPIVMTLSPPPNNTIATGTVVMAGGNITGPFAPGMAYLNGFCYVLGTNGYVYNSAFNDPATWPGSWLAASSDPDAGVALIRHLNYIAVFGQWSTEFFYDAANPLNSPLAVNQAAKLEIGCANGYSVAGVDQSVVWIGQSLTDGRAVYLLDGLSPVKISTRYVEKFLNKASMQPLSSSASSVRSFCMKISGHTLYILSLIDIDITLVFDLDEKEWYQWTSQTGDNGTVNSGVEHYFSPTAFNGELELNNSGVYLQDDKSGSIYKCSFDNLSDNGNNIYMRSVSPNMDNGTNKRKFYPRVEVIGDKVAATGYVRHSDDDYNTWSTYRTVDLSASRPVLYQNGQARRRAWELFISDNVAIRLEALEIEDDIGETGQG